MSGDQPPVPDPAMVAEPSGTNGLLRHLAEEGFDKQFVPGERGVLRCTVCGSTALAGRYEIHEQHRLEGASDPDDMVLVVALTCPSCRARGAVVAGFGPAASADDSDLVAALAR